MGPGNISLMNAHMFSERAEK